MDLEKVLLLADGDEFKVGSPYVGSAVEATVVGHGRGDKVRIFKLRRRKNSRTQAGHRQNYTELEIVSIDGKKAEPATKAAPAGKAKPDSDDAEQKEAAPAAPEAVEDKAGDTAGTDAAPAPSDDEEAGKTRE